MTTAEIYAFMTICEEKNISRAAEKLFISQSSLSSKIKTLEKELGFVLFLRSKGQKQVILTDEGRQFYTLALEYKKIVESMMKLGGLKEKFRVSTINSLGTYLLPPVYEKFMEKRPDVILQIQDLDTKASYENVAKGFTEMALATSLRELPGVEPKAVFTEKMVLLCSKSGEYGDLVTTSELDVKEEIFIFWDEVYVDWHDRHIGKMEDAQIQLELMSQLEYFLSKGRSWALVPVSVAKGLGHVENIVKKNIDFEVPQRITYCCSAFKNPKKQILNDFIHCLKEVVGEMKNDDIKLLI